MKRFTRISRSISFLFAILFMNAAFAEPGWRQKESENFIIVYREPQAYLVPHILQSAEQALARLAEIFQHKPAQKILIATFDYSDSGSAGALSAPRNMIRLEIEPFELGYEFMPFHERIQWLMNHELTHIMVNDQASKAQSLSRALFSRVLPEQEQPWSVGFSLLANHTRYSPRWRQEGIAVFMETWLSGGYGRVLAGFDEMYFRSLILEKKAFPSPVELETKISDNSFLLGMLHYLYGARFVSYLAATYGVEKLLAWYRPDEKGFYQNTKVHFQKIYEIDLEAAWKDFARTEKNFQEKNLSRIEAASLTPIWRLRESPMGWITQAYLDSANRAVLFGNHQSHQLTALNTLSLKDGSMAQFGTLPSPSMMQVASSAFDPSTRLFFYTTNNNSLFRDVHVLDLETGRSKQLFEDLRVGQLTVSPQTHELWGIRHDKGKASLIYSTYPYRSMIPLITFDRGEVLQHLALSPSGRRLAATLHQTNGRQSVIVADLNHLRENGRFLYHTISEEGSPEFPSWSSDEKYLYWNAYTNGVSNIYRLEQGGAQIEAISHTRRGLFRPLPISEDTLFVFEFTSEGFLPALIPNRSADRLPAIAFLGQQIVDRNPQVLAWNIEKPKTRLVSLNQTGFSTEKKYRGLSNVKLHSLIPVIGGFQDQTVAGLYTRMADPFFVHDISLEAGLSISQNAAVRLGFHFKGRYTHRQKYHLELAHNASSSYDLFNRRKTGLAGTKLQVGHTHFLKYDVPHKIKQSTDLTFYHGMTSIHENFIAVEHADFAVLTSRINSQNTRRSIGSADSEHGGEWALSLSVLGWNPSKPKYISGINGEWGRYFTWASPHNVFHLKAAAGYRHNREDLAQGRFYFGGFGNRLLENRPVKQFRDAFSFPGTPVFHLSGNNFGKILLENNLPPWRFSKIGLGSHLLSHLDASLFSQGLYIHYPDSQTLINVGAQMNFVFEHWYNLESTLSLGAARAWDLKGGASEEWFISFKVLRN